ncbi:carboxypeptidase-like regulatory domain-containing protein [Algoriphagus hitonicola]|uniref:CarboxypepD_reg-like domain-containing protein n=1 Tax=Algoriphagus hitonicola TaxID=435880 RepID=A0A1I2UI95_9BACT|nr:carboxypeptidase-like regulatory domain-containing protein [Algoriphagus hitonicola]SFG75377.1 CarboxypepD_reg-like domain-containing protein [Algoriphagus hitonicola]
MKIGLMVILLFLGFSIDSQAQTYSFEILNQATQEPVPFAHIQVENELIGTVTDMKGRGTFSIPPEFSDKSIIVSFIGYKSLSVPVENLHSQKSNSLMIEESSTDLEEVQVIDIGMSPQEFINIALMKVDETFFTRKYQSSGLYNEQVIEDGDSTFFYSAKLIIESQGFNKAINKNRFIENDEAYLDEIVSKSGDQKYSIVEAAELVGFTLPYGDEGREEDSFISDFFVFKNNIEKVAFLENTKAYEGDWYFEKISKQEDKTVLKVSIGSKEGTYFSYWIDRDSYSITSMEGYFPYESSSSAHKMASYHPGSIRFRIDYFEVDGKSHLKQLRMTKESLIGEDPILGRKISQGNLTIENLSSKKVDKKQRVDARFVQKFLK